MVRWAITDKSLILGEIYAIQEVASGYDFGNNAVLYFSSI